MNRDKLVPPSLNSRNIEKPDEQSKLFASLIEKAKVLATDATGVLWRCDSPWAK